MLGSEALQSKLAHLPDQPGVYLFKDRAGELLYIGKAARLADRVRSYFLKSADHSPKTTLMISQIADLETMVTRSELEALILESNLVKRHRPRFNVVLRDDKQYPYLRLPVKEPFPRLSIVRRVQKDGALYYGPYTPAGALRETLKVIKKVFPLATCTIGVGRTPFACVPPVFRTTTFTVKLWPRETRAAMSRMVIEEIARVARGEGPRYRVV